MIRKAAPSGQTWEKAGWRIIRDGKEHAARPLSTRVVEIERIPDEEMTFDEDQVRWVRKERK